MKRIAVYLTIAPEDGGSFQYALKILEALVRLTTNDALIHVWFTYELWEARLEQLGFSCTRLLPRTGLARICHGVLRRIGRRLPAPASRRTLSHTFPHNRIADWQPDIVICPQMSTLFLPPGIRQINVIHDLMHIYEPRFPEVGRPAEVAARQELFSNIAGRRNPSV